MIRKFEYDEFQYILANGELTTVAQMTEDELRYALCETMTALDDVEKFVSRAQRVIDVWRK